MTHGERAARCLIYLQALAVAAGYILAIVLVDIFYVSRYVHDGGMAFGYSFCLAQAGFIAVLLECSLVFKFVRRHRELRWNRVRPVVLEKVSAWLGGTDCTADLREIRRRNPREVAQCFTEMLARVQGSARARLSSLAGELGLVEQWIREYRSSSAGRRREAVSRLALLDGDCATATLVRALADGDDEIKLEASRALIRSSGARELAEVFRTAVRESLLVRAVLTEALRPHAALLCESAVPETLGSGDAGAVRTALQVVRAWGKSLRVPDAGPLLDHEDPRVRAAALAIVPQLARPREFAPQILRSLADADERVRSAAADTAGRLRLLPALAPLQRCLEEGGAEATVAAAYALARIGPEGWRILERQVVGSRGAAACAALEALEQARSERLLAVGV